MRKMKQLINQNRIRKKIISKCYEITNKTIAMFMIICVILPEFSIIGRNVYATEPNPEEDNDANKSNNASVVYQEEGISKSGIYANINNRYLETEKAENYYNINIETEINDLNEMSQIIYKDTDENFIEELQREEYYEPANISIIYKYSNGEYQFGEYEGEETNVTYYPESAIGQLKSNLDFKVQRISINKDEFIEKFGNDGYIKLKNNDTVIGEININSPLSNTNELYLETENEYNEFVLETNLTEETTFVLKLSEKGETTVNVIKYEQNYSTIYNNNKNTRYISSKINKQEFDTVLGEEGYIEIYSVENTQETLIKKITKDSEIDEEENYIINYDGKIDKIKIVTSKFISTGKLNIKNKKEITEDINYSVIAVKAFQKLKNNFNLTIKNVNNEEKTEEKSIYLNMINTITEANLEINKESLTAIGTNTNVEFKISLNNSTNKSDLYANPMFVIELPDGIENIKINKTDILFDTELKIKNAEIIEYNNHKAIKIELEGKETKYINSSIATGTNIIINTEIKLEKLISIENNKIEFYYFNEYATNYKNQIVNKFEKDYVGYEEKTIDYVAPTGVFAVQGIKNYNKDESNIYSNEKENETVEGKLKIYSDEITATSTFTIINNSGSDCKNMTVIGRTMFEGNKNIDTNELLNSNITTKLNSSIKSNGKGINIYYSENENATTDLSLLENGWKSEVEDYSKIKSWMITSNNFKDKEILEFEYDFIIPEKLEYCFETSTNFKVEYNRETELGDVSLKVVSNTLKLTTGIGPRINISQEVSIGDGTEVNEKARIKYIIKIENIGSVDVKNLVIKDKIPVGTTYTEYKERDSQFDKSGYVEDRAKKEIIWNEDVLKPDESIIKEFEVVVNELPTIEEYYGEYPNFTKIDDEYYLIETNPETGEETKQKITKIPDIFITNYAEFLAEGFDVEIPSNTTKNKVNKIYFDITEVSSYVKEAYLVENQEYKYNVIITNNSDEKLKNIIAQKNIPENIEFVEAYQLKNGEKIENATFNKETNEVTWNIAEFNRNEIVQLEIKVKTKTLKDDVWEEKIITNTSVTDEKGIKYISNDVENNIAKPKLEMEVTVKPNTQYIKEKDEITYKIKVTNIGHIALEKIKITDDLPEEIVCKSVKYTKGDTNVSTTAKADGDVEININLKSNEYVEIEIIATTGKLDETKNEIDVTSIIKVEAKNIETMEERINQIIQVLKEDEGITDKFKIKGLVWFDENKNGRREKEEQLLSDIPVYAINKNGQTVGETKTNIIGEYSFSDLEKGEYLIVFLYDSNLYEVTQYQVKSVELELNSDVIKTDVILNNQITKGAVTDTIILKDKSALNIDMGLTSKPEFDLALNKYVSNIWVKTSKGQTEYNFNNKSLAKVEIKSSEIKNAVIMIEYSIEVTNQGDITGQVNKIADYMPEGLEFRSELNPNWYLASDKKLYNTELAGNNIEVGQTKTVNIILTKTNVGEKENTYENKAEIIEDYNEEGLKDRDSTPNNQKEEDDLGKASVIITVATGEGAVYVILGLIILIILEIGIILIQKMVLRNKMKGRYK